MRIFTPFSALFGSILLAGVAGCHHSHHAYRDRCDDDVIVIHQEDRHDYRWRENRHERDYHDYRGSERRREYSRGDDYRGGRDRFERPRGRDR